MEKDLTPRQWKLYEFLKEYQEYTNQEMMLRDYEDWLREDYLKPHKKELSVPEFRKKYGYGYIQEIIDRDVKGQSVDYTNLTSGRFFRKDLQALRNHSTIQKVITSKGIANTVEQAKEYLDRKQIKILKALKEYHIEKQKLEKHLQTRLQFNHERDFIEAVRKL